MQCAITSALNSKSVVGIFRDTNERVGFALVFLLILLDGVGCDGLV